MDFRTERRSYLWQGGSSWLRGTLEEIVFLCLFSSETDRDEFHDHGSGRDDHNRGTHCEIYRQGTFETILSLHAWFQNRSRRSKKSFSRTERSAVIRTRRSTISSRTAVNLSSSRLPALIKRPGLEERDRGPSAARSDGSQLKLHAQTGLE